MSDIVYYVWDTQNDRVSQRSGSVLIIVAVIASFELLVDKIDAGNSRVRFSI